MTTARTQLDPKDPAEIIDVTMDFAALASAITSPVVTIERTGGPPDATPSAMLSGSASVTGTTIRQRLINGVNGTDYLLRFQGTGSDGQRFVEAARLSVRTATA